MSWQLVETKLWARLGRKPISLLTVPAASHDYLLPPTTTCRLPQLLATSHNYLLPIPSPLLHLFREGVNGDATESFRSQSVVKEGLVLFYNEGVSYLYTSAADTHRPICGRQKGAAATANYCNRCFISSFWSTCCLA